jgi:hypothetical protein
MKNINLIMEKINRYIEMKQIDNYILEKLHLGKGTKLPLAKMIADMFYCDKDNGEDSKEAQKRISEWFKKNNVEKVDIKVNFNIEEIKDKDYFNEELVKDFKQASKEEEDNFTCNLDKSWYEGANNTLNINNNQVYVICGPDLLGIWIDTFNNHYLCLNIKKI